MSGSVRNCCRICLDTESKHVSILDNPTIQLHIKSCLPVNISTNDDLPKSICETCMSQLNEFYNFQLNARCSQDWLESSLQEAKKSTEVKIYVQPLPDSEYNSDSLLEFLNNTANIEEYLNTLGKDDIPSIVNMLDRADGTDTARTVNKSVKGTSPIKKNSSKPLNMDVDILDSDIEIVNELLMKESEPKKVKLDRLKSFSCFACQAKLDSIEKLSHHLSICDSAVRTCVHCNVLFDSKQKMREHALSHSVLTPLTCNCGQRFESKEKLLHHCRKCEIDHIASMGFIYSCKLCGKKFNERFQLFKHARAHVLKSEERECKSCGSKYKGDEELFKHEREFHGKQDNQSFGCKICSFTTKNHKEMVTHIKTHTELKTTKHLCESCGRCFASNASLQRHSSLHLPKPYKAEANSGDEHVDDMVMCDKCGTSVNCSNLTTHVC